MSATVRRDPLPRAGYTTEQARAHVALTRAIQDQFDQGIETPCADDPAAWDADLAGDPKHEEFLIRRAAGLCRTACPVFDLCVAFVATDPPVHGVVGGQYRRHPLDYRHRKSFKRDVKAEWAALAGTDEEGQAA